jgi:hypothetical protein
MTSKKPAKQPARPSKAQKSPRPEPHPAPRFLPDGGYLRAYFRRGSKPKR